jgi:hypothetical protein
MTSKTEVIANRPTYVAPLVVSYDERQVAEELGPVMLSGTGTRLEELQGNTSTTRGGTAKPRR